MTTELKKDNQFLSPDTIHDVKAMIGGVRNADQTILLDGNHVSIHSTLWSAAKQHPEFKLTDDVLFPQDHMDIR